MTNDMIIAAYQQLEIALAEDYEKLEKKLRFSNLFRKILCFVLLIATVICGSYAIILGKKWYLVLLLILAGFCATALLCGILVFLLKPVFYFRRRQGKKMHQYICEKEMEQQALELMLLDNNTPDPIPKETEPLYLKNSNQIRLKTVFSKYRASIQEMVSAKQLLRACEIEHQKNREWLWFGFALILIGLAVTVVLAILALYLLFVFLFLTVLIALVVGWIASQREYYAPMPRTDTYYDPRPERPSLLEIIFNATVGVIFASNDVSKRALEQAEKNFNRTSTEKEEYLQLLLPYCPILAELNPQPSQNSPPQSTPSQSTSLSAPNPPINN